MSGPWWSGSALLSHDQADLRPVRAVRTGAGPRGHDGALLPALCLLLLDLSDSAVGVGQGAPGANRVFMTVWDGGGTDTYDFSSYATGVTADLRPGAWTIATPCSIAHSRST